jgi:salicylate hydroxylase
MTVADRSLDVLIVGAGIAGLSAAIALGKQGHSVVVSSL